METEEERREAERKALEKKLLAGRKAIQNHIDKRAGK